MPSFDDATVSAAPPQEVWKILYDPYRFPEWWSGIETVAPAKTSTDNTDFTIYPTGYPDFPMPQSMRTESSQRRIVVSCLVSDLRFEWALESEAGGAATRISVHVDIPDAEAHRLDGQREAISAALTGLADLAARSAA
ncbi:MAG: hypothetical protein JWR35_409 [Marmoricola sp.]|jgi:uncharacterized protein YndB with AHSA1/START domain|nr:hypothetical protein [Marmoricola sp.]